MSNEKMTRRDCLCRLALTGAGACLVGLPGCSLTRDPRQDPTRCHAITSACTRCGSCIDSCPVEALREGTPTYWIDKHTCINCGACVDECPVSAIRNPKQTMSVKRG